MAEDKDKGKEGAAEEAPAKPKSKKKLFIIIGVVVLIVGGGAGFFLMSGSAPKEATEGGEPAEAAHEEENEYKTVELDTMIVNLSSNASFLKTKLLLQYDPKVVGEGGAAKAEGEEGGKKSAALPGKLHEREAMVRDAMIRVMSSKKAEDVLTPEGKEQLKEELIEAINEASGLEEPPIVAIFYVDFIIQ